MKITKEEAFLALCAMEGEAFQEAAESLPEAAESLRSKPHYCEPFSTTIGDQQS
jgi:hypothetical protein